ncbi:MAG: KH domain-containing protein [Candidatus Andersenbacteria bacterium]
MAEDRKSHDVEFVEYVVKSIVDHPEDVKLDRDIDEMGVLITLTVNPEDMGQVIGRSGATAKSVRTLLRVIGARNNARVNLKINEPEGGTGAPSAPRESAEAPAAAPEASPEAPVEEKKQSVEDALDDLEL